ncbi:MAG: RluA family pseudouridine synthase [Planctomycetaceae bacterium]
MIPVVWNHRVAAVVLKPPGLATQAPVPYPSLETTLREQFASRTDYLAFPHRLDRPVGGLILVAFTKRVARVLSEQFEARRVRKSYLALVEGVLAQDSETWTDPLRKIEGEARVEIANDDAVAVKPDVKLATLDMRVILRLPSRTLLELRPSTGRMHQLRIQTASRGHAIVGDTLYGSAQSCTGLTEGAIALQAAELEFNDPTTGRRVTAIAPPPDWDPRNA